MPSFSNEIFSLKSEGYGSYIFRSTRVDNKLGAYLHPDVYVYSVGKRFEVDDPTHLARELWQPWRDRVERDLGMMDDTNREIFALYRWCFQTDLMLLALSYFLFFTKIKSSLMQIRARYNSCSSADRSIRKAF